MLPRSVFVRCEKLNVMGAAVRKLLYISVLSLGACGGGGSSSSDAPVTNQSVGGIWTTQYTETSGPNNGDVINAQAIVDEQGDFYFFALDTTNGCASLGFGQASVSGSAVTAASDWGLVTWTTVNGVTPNCVEPDGSTTGTGSITGTVAQRASLTLTETDTTANGSMGSPTTTTWTYNSLYSQASSLATIAGNYMDGSATLSIDSNGVIFEQDSNGCVLNGQVYIPNTSYNAYTFSVSFTGCPNIPNGATANGIAMLDTTQSPNQLIAGIHGAINGQVLVEALDLPKQ
jgi:hypothetical protein